MPTMPATFYVKSYVSLRTFNVVVIRQLLHSFISPQNVTAKKQYKKQDLTKLN